MLVPINLRGPFERDGGTTEQLLADKHTQQEELRCLMGFLLLRFGLCGITLRHFSPVPSPAFPSFQLLAPHTTGCVTLSDLI